LKRQQYIDAFTLISQFNVTLTSQEQHTIHIYKRINKCNKPNLLFSKSVWLSSVTKREYFCDIQLVDIINGSEMYHQNSKLETTCNDRKKKKRLLSCSDDEREEEKLEPNTTDKTDTEEVSILIVVIFQQLVRLNF
jgi:hypothetical protein